MSSVLVQRLAELNLIRDPVSAGTKTLVISRHRKTTKKHHYIAPDLDNPSEILQQHRQKQQQDQQQRDLLQKHTQLITNGEQYLTVTNVGEEDHTQSFDGIRVTMATRHKQKHQKLHQQEQYQEKLPPVIDLVNRLDEGGKSKGKQTPESASYGVALKQNKFLPVERGHGESNLRPNGRLDSVGDGGGGLLAPVLPLSLPPSTLPPSSSNNCPVGSDGYEEVRSVTMEENILKAKAKLTHERDSQPGHKDPAIISNMNGNRELNEDWFIDKGFNLNGMNLFDDNKNAKLMEIQKVLKDYDTSNGICIKRDTSVLRNGGMLRDEIATEHYAMSSDLERTGSIANSVHPLLGENTTNVLNVNGFSPVEERPVPQLVRHISENKIVTTNLPVPNRTPNVSVDLERDKLDFKNINRIATELQEKHSLPRRKLKTKKRSGKHSGGDSHRTSKCSGGPLVVPCNSTSGGSVGDADVSRVPPVAEDNETLVPRHPADTDDCNTPITGKEEDCVFRKV